MAEGVSPRGPGLVANSPDAHDHGAGHVLSCDRRVNDLHLYSRGTDRVVAGDQSGGAEGSIRRSVFPSLCPLAAGLGFVAVGAPCSDGGLRIGELVSPSAAVRGIRR